MNVTIQKVGFEKAYSIDYGPVSHFFIAISPAEYIDSETIEIDYKNGIMPDFRANSLIFDHENLAKAFEDIAKRIRQKYS